MGKKVRLYVQIAFWLYGVGIVLKMLHIAKDDYPRVERTISSGAEELMWLLLNVCLMIWTGSLLWGWL